MIAPRQGRSSPRSRRAAPVLLKWGGSLITDKTRPEHARTEVIERLARELAEALPSLPGGIVLGHGSGSFGHVAARRQRLAGALDGERHRAGVAAVQRSAARLHRMVIEALLDAGLAPYSWPASAAMLAVGARPTAPDAEAVGRALDFGMLPVTGGDVLLDRRLGAAVCSTEAVLTALAEALGGVRRAVWLGATAGILDAGGRTVPRVEAANLDAVREALGATRGTDVTGGMALRLDAAWELAGRGITSLIADGREPGSLARALAGDDAGGTLIPARAALGSVESGDG